MSAPVPLPWLLCMSACLSFIWLNSFQNSVNPMWYFADMQAIFHTKFKQIAELYIFTVNFGFLYNRVGWVLSRFWYWLWSWSFLSTMIFMSPLKHKRVQIRLFVCFLNVDLSFLVSAITPLRSANILFSYFRAEIWGCSDFAPTIWAIGNFETVKIR